MNGHHIKPGVDLSGLSPQIGLAISLAIPLFQSHNAQLVITSVRDGKHMPGSLHYVGLAVDLRIRELPPHEWEPIVDQLRLALSKQYDVILETDPPHIHIEYQPKA